MKYNDKVISLRRKRFEKKLHKLLFFVRNLKFLVKKDKKRNWSDNLKKLAH
ncbi:hypothetical protein [Caloramator sp. E03]|uniref:hypothetical protein n=1 Tax=Caloramator sp. E03 TaxID=2576307 RepID=UPI00143DA5D9|nr:hypothetical protein [Caloramator sp. E03]